MEDEFSLEALLSLTKKDKAGFWSMMYEKVRDAIEYDLDHAVILEFKESTSESDEMVEVTSFILDSIQFYQFLENYLIFCESEEDFETCIDVKRLIDKLLKKDDEGRG